MLIVVGFVLTVLCGCSAPEDRPLAATILADHRLAEVEQQALSLLSTSLDAGDVYPQVWVRDLATFIEAALRVHSSSVIADALLPFFQFQRSDGSVPDGYLPAPPAPPSYFWTSRSRPDLVAFKNTAETDQESSLVRAVVVYVRQSHDKGFLDRSIDGRTVRLRLLDALEYVHRTHWSPSRELIWGATTADWGDVQAEDGGVGLTAASHRAIDVYDNALYALAISDALGVDALPADQRGRWRGLADGLRNASRRLLWDEGRHAFRAHIYLNGSPFSSGVDESRIVFHGGTIIAIEAGFLSPREARDAISVLESDVRAAGARSIALSIFPPYPDGTFPISIMDQPYEYQNGGEWPWFGARVVRPLIDMGYVDLAYRLLSPMVDLVISSGQFAEWWTIDGRPQGSTSFRGTAGALWSATASLREWASSTTPGGAA
jgi:hypothetical protein